MNNSNFGNDFHNNIDKCDFKAIYDEIDEISHIQSYTFLYFNDDYKDFACPETINRQIEQKYNSKIMSIKDGDPCAEAKLYCPGQKRNKKMDAVEYMVSKAKRKKTFRDSEQKTIDHLKNPITKMIIDFDCESSVSINSLAVNKTNEVKVTTRFFSGKMLIFTKLSLMSFIYDLIDTFYFPNLKTNMIYCSYGVERIFPYHILTDTDSTSILFHIICEAENSVPDNKFRDIIFEVIVQNDVINDVGKKTYCKKKRSKKNLAILR